MLACMLPLYIHLTYIDSILHNSQSILFDLSNFMSVCWGRTLSFTAPYKKEPNLNWLLPVIVICIDPSPSPSVDSRPI